MLSGLLDVVSWLSGKWAAKRITSRPSGGLWCLGGPVARPSGAGLSRSAMASMIACWKYFHDRGLCPDAVMRRIVGITSRSSKAPPSMQAAIGWIGQRWAFGSFVRPAASRQAACTGSPAHALAGASTTTSFFSVSVSVSGGRDVTRDMSVTALALSRARLRACRSAAVLSVSLLN